MVRGLNKDTCCSYTLKVDAGVTAASDIAILLLNWMEARVVCDTTMARILDCPGVVRRQPFL
jgi:hypothetical protein